MRVWLRACILVASFYWCNLNVGFKFFLKFLCIVLNEASKENNYLWFKFVDFKLEISFFK